MEDKMFMLMIKMYNEVTANMENIYRKLESIDKKLDSKADKRDIV